MNKWIKTYIFISLFIMLGQITHADSSSSKQFAPLPSAYDSQNATIFIPAVDLVDQFGNTQSFRVWLKIIDNFTF